MNKDDAKRSDKGPATFMDADYIVKHGDIYYPRKYEGDRELSERADDAVGKFVVGCCALLLIAMIIHALVS